jgi:hypothetical protein
MRAFLVAGITAVLAWSVLASDRVEVEFLDPCECQNNHGVYRWDAKVDQEGPPDEIAPDHKVTPSVIAGWPEPRGQITTHSPRSGREKEWFELTGKVVLAKAEADGDVHIQLVDADKPDGVNVVVEIPVKQHAGVSPWCKYRTTVFKEWSNTEFPFTITSDKPINLKSHPVIRVEGKAFFDAQHKGSKSNRRNGEENVSVWEIHPVMMMSEVP